MLTVIRLGDLIRLWDHGGEITCCGGRGAKSKSWRDLKRHQLAHQTFTGAEHLDQAIHEAVPKLNRERNRHPLPNQRIAA
jgi:hypothetical protein